MASEWRYILQRLSGPDKGKIVHHDLPLKDVSIERVLSGPGVLDGNLPIADALDLVQPDGTSLIDEWGTAIWAEASGQIRGGGIVASAPLTRSSMNISCMGLSGYPKDQPYDDIYYGVQVDPLDMFRKIWDHVQAQPDSDLGIDVDFTTSPVRIGTELTVPEFTTGLGEVVTFEAGPFKLAWWVTDDLGREIDTLASETPFDYLEHTDWDEGGTTLQHRIELGYPTIGRRRDDLRFVVGENILKRPAVASAGDGFANGVLVLGAGEGRDRVRSPLLYVPDGRLRRVVTVEDKEIRQIRSAVTTARNELNTRGGNISIDQISVIDHPNAPLGSFDVGDEIPVDLHDGARPVSQWGRVVSITLQPAAPDVMQISMERTDRLTS